MKKYEYKIEKVQIATFTMKTDRDGEEILNKYGQEGYELVFASDVQGQPRNKIMTFKREIE